MNDHIEELMFTRGLTEALIIRSYDNPYSISIGMQQFTERRIVSEQFDSSTQMEVRIQEIIRYAEAFGFDQLDQPGL